MLNVTRLAIAPIAALLLASCAAMFGENMPSTVVDNTFTKRTIKFSMGAGIPEDITVYLKVFNQDGMLAVCGVSGLTGKGVLDQFMDLWKNDAFVAVKSASKKIVSARFIGQIEEYEKTKPANCVKTTTPSTPELLNARVTLAGGSVYWQ